jgi:hypothetical protein
MPITKMVQSKTRDGKKTEIKVRKSKNWKENYRRMTIDDLPEYAKLGIVGDVKFKWSDEQ